MDTTPIPPPEQPANAPMTREQVIEHYSRKIDETRKISAAAVLVSVWMPIMIGMEAEEDVYRKERLSGDPVVVEYRQTAEYLENLRQVRSRLGGDLFQSAPPVLKPQLDNLLSDERRKIEALDSVIAEAESHEENIKKNPRFKYYQGLVNKLENATNLAYCSMAYLAIAFAGTYFMWKDRRDLKEKLKTFT